MSLPNPLLLLTGLTIGAALILPPSYDIVWNTPAPPVNGSSSSMPVGGGDIGLNVWVENDTVLFYVGKDGCFDENNSLLKLGRVRLTLDPNPFAHSQAFEQRLVLEDGYVQISAGNSSTVKLWVDVFNPVVHVEVSTSARSHLTASFEDWRNQDHVMALAEQAQSSWNGVPDMNTITWKDNVTFWRNNSVLSSHRNINSRVFDATLAQQQLSDYKEELYDPLANNTFGMVMYGSGLAPTNVTSDHYVNSSYESWNLQSTQARTTFNLTIVAHTNQTSSYSQWQDELVAIDASASNQGQGPTVDWWNSFWNRSYIFVNPNSSTSDPSFQVGRNYQLFRYMLGCNAFSKWPSKFNGALFTFDPVYVNPNYPFTPDFRLWGGGTYTAQNQRLMYWPLLKSGDLDMMIPQFNFYERIVGTSTLRGRVYHNINHSWLTEQIDNSGLPQIFNFNPDIYIYGTKRPLSFNPGLQFDAWIIWLSDTALEFAMMILDAVQFFSFDATPYMPFIENEIMWFDVLYTQMQQSRDVYGLTGTSGNETLVLYPATGCETYKAAYNPASTVSGLRAIVTRILQVNPQYAIGNTSYYQGLLQRIPSTPLRQQQGHQCIAPAEAYARLQNVEIPQLYPVFPWHEYGLGLPNLSYAINTYLYDTETQAFHSYEGWKQDAIWLADMGLADMAQNVTTLKLQDSNTNRFPTFWGPGFDWTPQMDTGGTGMIALQDMLMQTYGNASRTIRLLPAWPGNWTAEFKLVAPFNTTVEGSVRGGKLVSLSVDPTERRGDVII
ncbi:hypothetical protein LTS14_010422 [Recurvomyces mirabilis]|uniref:uncharacterized protein n=1 Tax=Recurvomyces mirabilis TaxID=574656 RepID=UPI002DE0CF2B|nr:hypothetical protein LTS14_010422 [Recurvomyces mirabilis]